MARTKYPKAVDPAGCRCTDCLTHWSVPLDWASPKRKRQLLSGKLANRTGLSWNELAERLVSELGINTLVDAVVKYLKRHGVKPE